MGIELIFGRSCCHKGLLDLDWWGYIVGVGVGGSGLKVGDLVCWKQLEAVGSMSEKWGGWVSEY